MWLTPHPHAISIDKKMSNLVTVNYNKLVTMEGVSNIIMTVWITRVLPAVWMWS